MWRSCALVALLWVLSSRHALGQADVPAHVEALLVAGIDSPLSLAQLAALGPDVVPALRALYGNEQAPAHARLRALWALARLDDDRATQALLAVVEQARATSPAAGPGTFARSAVVLRRALEGLLARPLLVLAPAPLLALLGHEHADVREAAAQLLARTPTKAVRAALTERARSEPRPQVRTAMTLAITGRSARPTALRLVRPESGSPPR